MVILNSVYSKHMTKNKERRNNKRNNVKTQNALYDVL